jgi:phenylacetate-CoA ligase
VDRRRFLARSQWWSAERLREFQWAELTRLLAHVFASVPFLRQKYHKAGIALEDVRSWDDFRRLPTLTRNEVNTQGRALCSTAYNGRLLPHATGGSTGVPTRFFRTYESYDWRVAAKDRAYSWSGWQLGEPAIYLWGAPVGPRSRLHALKVRAHEAVQRHLVINTFSQDDALWRRAHERALRHQPALVVGYVSSLDAFAGFLRKTGRSLPSLTCAIAAAEPLFDDARCRIEEALDVPVFNTYGCREFMSIAAECELREGLHVQSENLIVETNTERGGEPSEILVTDLHNYGMPLVRYEIGDLGTMTEVPCGCGRGLPRLQAIEGRLLDALRTTDGRIVPGEFFPHLLKEIPELIQYQVEQARIDRIVISAVLSSPLSEKSESLLQHEVRRVFGASTICELRPVREVPKLTSGKRRITVGLRA